MRLSSTTVGLIACFLLLATTGCKSSKTVPEVGPENGIWVHTHNYNIVHPTKPSARESKQVVYPPCPCPPAVETPGVPVPHAPRDNPCETPPAGSCGSPDGCGGEGGMGMLGGETGCIDGMCSVDVGGLDAMGTSSDTFSAESSEGEGGLHPALILGTIGVGLAAVAWFAFGTSALMAVLFAFLLLISTTGCVGIERFASEADVAESDERTTAAFEAQAETFNEHLATNPGDIEGATGAAFGASVEQHKKKPEPSPQMPGFVDLLLTPEGAAGGGALGLIIMFLTNMLRNNARRKRGEPVTVAEAEKPAE